MARADRRLAANAPGDIFVDSSCIDCAACRWLAPATFAAHGGRSRVARQPNDAAERHRALMALIACPVAAIGTAGEDDLGAARAAFPDPIASNVYHCGFHAAESYGAASYLIVRPNGNVLIDSPVFNRPLAERIEALGGIAYMFLTHRDDVVDHEKFHFHFDCTRIIHADDATPATREVEIRITGEAPLALDHETTVIPVPGHTAGSACLLYRDEFLFSGDHIAWDPDERRITAWRDVCWFDWNRLVASNARLLERRFEWILPGHGHPCHLPAPEMAEAMRECQERLAQS